MQWDDKRKKHLTIILVPILAQRPNVSENFFLLQLSNLFSLHRVLPIINHSRISRIQITREFVFLIMSFNFKINITDSFKYLHILNADGYNMCACMLK